MLVLTALMWPKNRCLLGICLLKRESVLFFAVVGLVFFCFFLPLPHPFYLSHVFVGYLPLRGFPNHFFFLPFYPGKGLVAVLRSPICVCAKAQADNANHHAYAVWPFHTAPRITSYCRPVDPWPYCYSVFSINAHLVDFHSGCVNLITKCNLFRVAQSSRLPISFFYWKLHYFKTGRVLKHAQYLACYLI